MGGLQKYMRWKNNGVGTLGGLCTGVLCMVLCPMLAGCGKEEQEERPKITWCMIQSDEELYNNLKGIEKIEKATGVDIVFELMSIEDYNYMIASGKYPDVCEADLYSGEVLDLYNNGIAIDLTDLIEEKSVYLKKIYEERQDIFREAQTNDGRLIYFPSLNPMESEYDLLRLSYAGLILRKDWLDKLGLKAPTTMDEWYQVLNAFKTQDPNGNGISDEIPFDDYRYHVFCGAFGILDGIYIDSTGTVSYGPLEDEYVNFLKTMNQWYEEGLIGNSAVTGSSKWSDINIINDVAGSFYGLDNAWRHYLPSIREKNKKADLVAVNLPATEEGKVYTNRSNLKTHIRQTVTVITSSCEKPEAALKVIDYMYSEEGSDLLTWGIEGETYEIAPNGTKYLTKEALEYADDGYLNIYHTAIGHIPFPKYDGESVVLATFPQEQLIAEKIWSECDTSLIYPPNILFSSDERKVINDILGNIEMYVEDAKVEYITGVRPFDTVEEFRENIYNMGIEEVIKIYQKNYEIYLGKK